MAKPLKPARPPGLRCAIYTRKSTEEGLDQAFNSLDAQREACAAYIVSQKHEGWSLVPDAYDDGGFSGGNMQRPRLVRLMADIAAGKVDVIVVYKVDRLTRALSDFARIVDVLDRAGASFVSVTQAFNTTTSMGRLTLNVLLSFAQFEREVTGERIRDKIAASKKKGMWMGGPVPLGYDVHERKLIVNETEAVTVRLIFERYGEFGSIGQLADDLDQRGIRSKRRQLADYGHRTFSKGALAHLLKNRVYIGETCHKGASYPGEHLPIVDRALWDRVQETIADRRRDHRLATRADQPSPLAGMIGDDEGRALTPTHATKGSRRYRYYVTASASSGEKPPASSWRIPAGEIEQLVRTSLTDWLSDDGVIIGELAATVEQAALAPMLTACADAARRITAATPSELRIILHTLDTRITLAADIVRIEVAPQKLMPMVDDRPTHRSSITVPATITRRGQELRLVYQPADRIQSASPDVKLIGLLGKAEAAYRQLLSGNVQALQRPHLSRLARLKFLAPDITAAILDGRQPVQLSARRLLRATTIPLGWSKQRKMLGFA